MLKGQVVAGDFGKIVMRVKANEQVELGELVVIDNSEEKFILQVYDLVYGSQISQQNLEMVAGMNLEESSFNIMDESLRNYQLAFLKPVLNVKDGSKTCKKLPSFFTKVREIQKEDLSFITQPRDPFFLGKLRSGSKEMDFDIFLPGRDVFSHHVLIPASTGKGKSLDENEEVLIKQNGLFSIKPIGEIVNNPIFMNSKVEVLSMNPKNYSVDFKEVTNFVRHKAPSIMYQVSTQSGREVMVTKDHNLYVLRNGILKILKTQDIADNDYIPLPLKINQQGNLEELNLFDLLKKQKEIYILPDKNTLGKLKPKQECLKILSKYMVRPLQKYNDLVIKNHKIKITILSQLLKEEFSYNELQSITLTDYHGKEQINGIYPLSGEFLQLLGYYVAEGYCLNDTTFRISCSEKDGQDLLNHIFNKLGLHYFWIKKKGTNADVGVSSSIFTKILKGLGVGRVSGDKRLPDFFMSLSNKNLAILLRTYFEGDGGVDIVKVLKKRNFIISTTTKSQKLASDICFALYRYGIFSRCKKMWKRATNAPHQGNWYYRIKISGKTNMVTFLSKIGFQFSRKNDILDDKLDYEENTNVDLIPVDPKLFKSKRVETGLSRAKFALKLNCSYSMISAMERGVRRPSRNLFKKVLSEFRNFQDLKCLMNFRWDKIKEVTKVSYNKKYVYDLTVKDNKTFLAGHGGMFVHNSNLMSCVLWDLVDKDYSGMLVLDPHDEYYGRTGLGLKDHPRRDKMAYYTPVNPPPGARSLKIHLSKLKPDHFMGAIGLSDPQRQCLHVYYKKFKQEWIRHLLAEEKIENVKFHEDTMAVVKRKLISLLGLDFENGQLSCEGIFDTIAGENTISEICSELEQGKIVIIDTSYFSGAIEILVGSLITNEIFDKYKYYKRIGQLDEKPVVSIVLEEAPRVLGTKVLEQGSNIFETLAREGRKFKVGLVAITQLPSEIPKNILANMNTKIILGIEMNSERNAVIESSPQDLSQDGRNIASLDKGEALVTSTFTRFAVPVKIPLFKDFVKKDEKPKTEGSYIGFS
jgi:DNA helicase HerA-like ATPase/intein/homing endonuclease